MKAVVLHGITPSDKIQITEVPTPRAVPGWVVVKIRAFGLNHSEQILRLNEIRADYIQKPIIPGIECVGEIADAGDSNFKKGQKVIALMGGMGRSFNGSYAEYALLPVHHVFAVQTDMPWENLAAVPETFFTAWGSLFDCLHLTPQDTLLVRGATCALGYAAIQLAKALGCKVVATTHREAKLALLENSGADECVLDTGVLRETCGGMTKALELVGSKTLRDTLLCMRRGGIVCNTGILGGVYYLNEFDPIKEIPNGVYLTGFFSNYPTVQTIDEMFAFLNKNKITPRIGKVYPFAEIATACRDMDEGKVDGKLVVVVG